MNIPRGREDVAKLFQNIIKSGRVSQTYIINGPEGMGKKTVTEYILSLLLCDSHLSCGSCPSCNSLAEGIHPDVVYLRRSPDKASLGVKNVREIKTEVYTRPVMADYKVVVAPEFELATTEAQNAMLKMLEEPPERVVFFLLCSSEKSLLSTIVSRAVTINLRPMTFRVLKEIFGAEDSLIYTSEGNPGKLCRLMEDTDYTDLRSEVADAYFSVTARDAYSPYDAARRLEKLKSGTGEVLEIILSLARDVYFKRIGLDDRIINKDKANYISAASAGLTEKKAANIVNHIKDTIVQKGQNGNQGMAITVMLLKCRREMR